MRRDENKIRSGTVEVNNQKQFCKATQLNIVETIVISKNKTKISVRRPVCVTARVVSIQFAKYCRIYTTAEMRRLLRSTAVVCIF